MPIHRVDLDSSTVSRRFSIEQGRNADGSVKIRSVDDETDCGTNTCVKPAEKLRCDGLDVIFALAVLYVSLGQTNLSFWKADFKSAYRLVPVRPDQRWLLWVALWVGNEVMAPRQNAMPFGCTGVVCFMQCVSRYAMCS